MSAEKFCIHSMETVGSLTTKIDLWRAILGNEDQERTANGTESSEITATFAWDPENRLVQALQTAPTVQFDRNVYDATSHRQTVLDPVPETGYMQPSTDLTPLNWSLFASASTHSGAVAQGLVEPSTLGTYLLEPCSAEPLVSFVHNRRSQTQIFFRL